MNILNTHIYKLRFKLDFDATEKYIKKWNKIKEESETSDNKYLVEEIKNNCKLESNKNLPYLQRNEGGLGGNNNQNNKQIRFRFNFNSYKFDDDILLSLLFYCMNLYNFVLFYIKCMFLLVFNSNN